MPERGNQKGNQNIGNLPFVGKGGGARILLSWFQNWLISKVNSNTLLSIAVPIGSDTTSGGVRFADIKITPDGTRVTLPAQTVLGGGSSSGSLAFRGEYDQTKRYEAGETFIISNDTTISGVVVVAGYYGVPPAGTDAVGNWYGYVPAYPTGNAVPQHPLPAIGAAPNDKFYARIIIAYC